MVLGEGIMTVFWPVLVSAKHMPLLTWEFIFQKYEMGTSNPQGYSSPYHWRLGFFCCCMKQPQGVGVFFPPSLIMSHTFISICAMHFYSIKKLLSNLIEVLARISFFGSTHSHNSINFFLYSVGPNRWRWTSTAYRLCPLYQSNSWKVHMSNRDIINYFMWKMWFQDSEKGKYKRFA